MNQLRWFAIFLNGTDKWVLEQLPFNVTYYPAKG